MRRDEKVFFAIATRNQGTVLDACPEEIAATRGLK